MIISLISFSLVNVTYLQEPFSLKTFSSIDLPSREIDIKEECGVGQEIEYYYYKDTEWDQNNKFGLYVYAESGDFFEIAQNLVNSSGGEWGYVLIPFNVKDEDFTKWRRVFAQLRSKQLIPIIQLWDIDPENYLDQTEEAAEFLNSFIWPVKPKYISAYNEMNDANFWYGYINPEEYSDILEATIEIFKDENEDFFIMNGAFNVSAATTATQLDAFEYMRRMHVYKPGIFNRLDGWASHSYPQPNFSGSPYATGRNSIRAYETELQFLENELGVTKELPVFITETGWAHAEGVFYNNSYYDVEKISEFFKIAFEEVWLKDDRVRAVTPFTIRYDPPFDHFSWVNKDNVPYKHYDVVKDIDKIKGNPPSLEVGHILKDDCIK